MERAEFALRQALSIWSEMGHFYYVAFSEWCLGRLFRIMGDTGAAVRALDAAAEGYLALANDRELARIEHERVLLSRDLGDFATAINQADETLAAWMRFDDVAGIVESLELIGTLAAEDGQYDVALRLLTMAGTWGNATGHFPTSHGCRHD